MKQSRFEAREARKKTQRDEKRQAKDVGAQGLNESAGCRSGSAGGQHVVDDEDSRGAIECVRMNLEHIGAVFELIGLRALVKRKLPRLPHRDKSRPQLLGNRAAEYEPTALDR